MWRDQRGTKRWSSKRECKWVVSRLIITRKDGRNDMAVGAGPGRRPSGQSRNVHPAAFRSLVSTLDPGLHPIARAVQVLCHPILAPRVCADGVSDPSTRRVWVGKLERGHIASCTCWGRWRCGMASEWQKPKTKPRILTWPGEVKHTLCVSLFNAIGRRILGNWQWLVSKIHRACSGSRATMRPSACRL